MRHKIGCSSDTITILNLICVCPKSDLLIIQGISKESYININVLSFPVHWGFPLKWSSVDGRRWLTRGMSWGKFCAEEISGVTVRLGVPERLLMGPKLLLDRGMGFDWGLLFSTSSAWLCTFSSVGTLFAFSVGSDMVHLRHWIAEMRNHIFHFRHIFKGTLWSLF